MMRKHKATTFVAIFLGLAGILRADPFEMPYRTTPVFEGEAVRGKAETVVTRSFLVGTDGKESPMGARQVKFDGEGKLIEWATVQPNGSIVQPARVSYDEKGRKTEVSQTDFSGQPSGKFVFAYGADGKTVGVAQTSTSQGDLPKVTGELDEKGRPAKLHYEGPAEKLDYALKYDDQGRVVEVLYGRVKEGVYPSKVAYTYNEKGDVAKEDQFRDQAKFENMVMTHVYEPRDSFSYEYKYDDKGNWTDAKMTEVRRTGKTETSRVAKRMERVITYAK